MVVSSPTARVVCIDIGALRSWLLGSPAGNAVASDVVAAVVEHDVALYGRAVKQIAVQVRNGRARWSEGAALCPACAL